MARRRTVVIIPLPATHADMARVLNIAGSLPGAKFEQHKEGLALTASSSRTAESEEEEAGDSDEAVKAPLDLSRPPKMKDNVIGRGEFAAPTTT